MHSLVFKRLEIVPKKMDKELDDKDSKSDIGGLQYLFTADPDEDCQPCNPRVLTMATAAPQSVLDSIPHNPHSSTCSYGIQALINNVYRGYINDEEEDHPDQSRITESSQQQESEILRQWKMKKEVELEERQRESQAKQDRILEQAEIERENFYKEREAQIEAKKRLNRERETKYYEDVQSQQKVVEGNLWEAVAALIDLNGEVEGKAMAIGSGKQLPKSELSTPSKLEHKGVREQSSKLMKTTDLSRMREILLKLQSQPLVRSSSQGAEQIPSK